jgi:hypothetical protein
MLSYFSGFWTDRSLYVITGGKERQSIDFIYALMGFEGLLKSWNDFKSARNNAVAD